VFDYLLPICFKLKFELVITPEISIELRPGDEFKEVGVESHLVPGHGIEERRDAFVEKAQEEWKIRDDSTSQCFDVMLLKDRKYLSNQINYAENNGSCPNRALALLATDIEGLVRRVVVL